MMTLSPNRVQEYTTIRNGKIPHDTRRLDCVKDLIKAARSNRFSALRKLSASDLDIFDVWDSVSKLIECHMAQQKAVHIPGLGSFTFTTSKLEVGHNKYILIQRPVFILSEKLVRTHRLTQSRYHVPGEIPVIQLNFTALSYVLSLDRDLVEASIKEVVNALSHNIEQNRSCEFAFTTIGNLLITNGTAKMKFLPSFLEKMGQRVGMLTADAATSVLADKCIVLPKIQPGKDIELSSPRNSVCFEQKEDAMKENNDGSVTDKLVSSRYSASPKTDLNKSQDSPSTPVRLSPTLPRKDFLTTALKNSPPKHQRRELLTPNMKLRANNSEKQVLTSPVEKKRQPKQDNFARDQINEYEPRKNNSAILQHKPSKTSLLNLLQNKPVLPSPKPSTRMHKEKEQHSCGNCTEHMNDFCYLCFQREKRNIPVNFNVERKREEEDEDKILQAYMLMTDSEDLRNEQQKKHKNRQNAQEIAAFNLGVAEKLKKTKDVRPEDFERSYVFHNRPVTPPHYIKQDDYQDELALQVSEKKKRHATLKKEAQSIERKEQLHLADELADQWKTYLKNKGLASERYRKALDAQLFQKKTIDQERELDDGRRFVIPRPNVVLPFQKIRVSTNATNMMDYTSSELPAAYPDSDGPIFGICDRDDKKIMERRQRAQILYQDQLEMAAKKRELAIARNCNKKKEEEDMLNRTKKELLEETVVRNSLNLQQRKDLEKTWAIHDMKKKTKELEERLRTRSPGLLLQEQCDKYDSCNQCTRKPTNYGRSNVWSESRYVSGSRLMV